MCCVSSQKPNICTGARGRRVSGSNDDTHAQTEKCSSWRNATLGLNGHHRKTARKHFPRIVESSLGILKSLKELSALILLKIEVDDKFIYFFRKWLQNPKCILHSTSRFIKLCWYCCNLSMQNIHIEATLFLIRTIFYFNLKVYQLKKQFAINW